MSSGKLARYALLAALALLVAVYAVAQSDAKIGDLSRLDRQYMAARVANGPRRCQSRASF